jgi:alcohol dehydrogenase class IV
MAGRLADAIATTLGTSGETLQRRTLLDVDRLDAQASISAPSLCSALAIADSTTFLMIFAPFLGRKSEC